MFKQANTAEDLAVTEDIMRRIYKEEPSYWPHGLSVNQFDDDGLFLISKSASEEPVGFVGWQSCKERHKDVGYYAIGVLPEHRQQGIAKKAVAQVIRNKSKDVDEVRALVMEANLPSRNLAASLVESSIEKSAGGKANLLKTIAKNVFSKATAANTGKGLTVGAIMDPLMHKDKGVLGYMAGVEHADPWASTDMSVNSIAGGLAGLLASKGKLGYAGLTLGTGIAKSTVGPFIRNQGTANTIARDANRIAEEAAKNESASGKDGAPGLPGMPGLPGAPATPGGFKIPTSALVGGGALGLGALALAAWRAKKKSDIEEAELEQRSKGRTIVTLPTKNPGDMETQVELPMDDVNLSQTIRGNLGRDTRRRLREETRARTRHRKSAALEILPLEDSFEECLGKIYREKSGAQAPKPSINTSVPSPPIPGQNPAMRQHQQATANSMPPSTDANPQIMKAEQAAMEAQQKGEQQAMEVSQQAAAELQASQQKAQVEISKKTQENEILKIQLEKQKAEADLAKQKTDSASSTADGDMDAVARMTKSRLDRLGSRVSKSAATTPVVDPTPPEKAPSTLVPGEDGKVKRLKPGWGQRLNDDDGATKHIAPISNYRHSYGQLGDTLYDMFARPWMLTPRAQGRGRPSPYGQALGSPDILGSLTKLYGVR